MSSAASDPRIRVLPLQVANQIAAGEVVERPASVVKELLENSLDAGARSIELDIEKGGVQRILLRDDGHGIHRDDLLLALSPHATSKIATAEDLEGVGSLGFRGEALASIASVSRLLLKSRRRDKASGWQLRGGEQQTAPAALLPGTEIEVCDLFYNTPARRKFLRAERTELSHVEEVVRRIALSRFDLAVRFVHNGKTLLRVKAADSADERARRVAEVVGKQFLDNSRVVDVAAAELRLWGWIGRADYSRSHADCQYVYLNGRMIRDRLVAHAIRLAFGEGIAEGRFPAYLLYLELDPRQVDVNVHPTKHEVRFREARQVHDFIYWAINGALHERSEAAVAAHGDASDVLAVLVDAQRKHATATQRHERFVTPLRPAVAERAPHYAHHHTAVARPVAATPGEQQLGRALAQLRSGYLLTERSDATLLIELRALLVQLNRYRLASPLRDELLIPQPLLIPCSVTVGRALARLWRQEGERLVPWGFEWGWLGEGVLVVRQVPAMLRAAAITPLVERLGRWLAGADEEALVSLLAAQALPDPLPAYSIQELNQLLSEYEQRMVEGDPLPWRLIRAEDWPRLFDSLS